MRNLDAAQNQFSSRDEAMHIIADSTSNHGGKDEICISNDKGTPNNEYPTPLRTVDTTTDKASCFVSSIIVSNRERRSMRRCCIYPSYVRAGEDRQFHQHFQPKASPLRCPTS